MTEYKYWAHVEWGDRNRMIEIDRNRILTENQNP